jgi:transcriptional regulator with XRE-family HTH domain
VWTRHRIADAEYPCHRRDLAAPTDRPRCERKDEHLDRGCRNCGHRWSADVLDREPASGAGSDEASRALSVSTPKAEMRDARERLESPCEKTGRDMVRLTAALGMEIGEWPQFVDEMVAKIGALKDVFRAATELRLACVTDGETHQRVRNIEVRALCSALDALDDRPAAQSRKNGATFADAIRSALSTRGMTQADLAAVVGSAPSVVSRALADGANPTLDTVTVYARAVGLRVAFVASESPPAPTGEVGEVLEVLRSCDGTDPEFGEQARRAIATVEGLRTFRDTVLAAMGLDDGDPTAEETAEWIERLAKSEAEKRATVERLQCEREAHRREYDQLRADLATVTRDRDDAQKHFESAAQAHDKLLAEVAARDEQIARLTTRLEEAEALLAYSQHARECRDSDPCRFYVAGGAPFPSKNCTAGQRLAAAAKTGTEEQGK